MIVSDLSASPKEIVTGCFGRKLKVWDFPSCDLRLSIDTGEANFKLFVSVKATIKMSSCVGKRSCGQLREFVGGCGSNLLANWKASTGYEPQRQTLGCQHWGMPQIT